MKYVDSHNIDLPTYVYVHVSPNLKQSPHTSLYQWRDIYEISI